MSLLLAITLFEIIYIIFMFFIYKTSYSFDSSFFGNKVKTDEIKTDEIKTKENKTSDLGKLIVFMLIISYLVRLKYNDKITSRFNLFVGICGVLLVLIGQLNYNDIVYLIPIVVLEIFINIFIKFKLDKLASFA